MSYTLSDWQLLGLVILSASCGGGLVVVLEAILLRHAPAAPADPPALWPDGQAERLLHDYDPRHFPERAPADYDVNQNRRRIHAIGERIRKEQP